MRSKFLGFPRSLTPLFISVASVMLAFLFVPTIVYGAEFPDAISSVTHGPTITQNSKWYRENFNPNNTLWTFRFMWPYGVSNSNAFFGIAKGTFGNGETPTQYQNFDFNYQQWPEGQNVIVKDLGFPIFGSSDAESDTYTIIIADMAQGFGGVQTMEWFFSGGASGLEPNNYTFLTFSYSKYKECCSSVVFLPGLKGSVLKTGSDILWPPSITNVFDFTEDILQLALNPVTGESVYPVSVDGVLENFYTAEIYSGFTTFMEDTVAAGTVSEWEAFPYDWRFSPEKVIQDENMIARLKDLAENSDTGKITIVAHSMGGLVGKEVIRELETEGNEDLVDAFVMVGTPQLGAPQAVASILHGDEEGILGGLIVNPTNVRSVAQNMPSAYNLLPSQAYFSKVTDPVITFNESADFTEEWRNFWGLNINNYLDFFSFITGGGVARVEPTETQLRIPEILRADLVSNANTLHTELDNYEIPSSIRTIQIAGWGVPTTKSVEYKNKHFLQSYQTRATLEGDGIVVYPSAVSSAGDIFYFNLDLFNELGINVRHKDLLNANKIQDLISKIFMHEVLNDIDYISQIKPNVIDVQDKLITRTNSPVILGVRDSLGRFTGIDPNQDLSLPLLTVTHDIPGSYFVASGDSQTIFLPDTGTYTFEYTGIGDGPTTVEVSKFSQDQETLVNQYSDIPTTVQTRVSFIVNTSIPEETVLSLDINGDGEIDEIVSGDTEELSFDEIIALLKQKIVNLEVKEKIKKNLLKRIQNLEKKINKKKSFNKKVSQFVKRVIRKADREKVSENDVEEIIALLEQLKNTI